MKKKDELIIKIGKSVIVVFGVLTVFNFIMLVNKKSYALFQKTIETGKVIRIKTVDKLSSENNSIDELKEKTSDGIQGMDPKTGTVCSGTECEEYRYVGTSVNNYVIFNDETWRIVGIFKDENDKEHLKIVRNQVLSASMFPATYTYNGTTYTIKYTGSGDYAYWNNKTDYNNDWATAGLQYYLNTEKDSSGSNKGYLSYLSTEAKGMIEETKYYLGSIDTYGGGGETPKKAYANERAVSGCSSNKGPSGNTSQSIVKGNTTCRVWANNAATWTGKVGLLYPSDYGYSASSSNWNSELYNFENESATSWLQSGANHSINEWLLSPSSTSSSGVSYWDRSGYVGYNYVDNSGVRPVLNLKSEIGIKSGIGTSGDPYRLG